MCDTVSETGMQTGIISIQLLKKYPTYGGIFYKFKKYLLVR
jgi:hypothetical protein